MNSPRARASKMTNAVWSGLPGHEPPPDGVALGPEVLALVVEPLCSRVDHDAERDAVHAGHDAAVEAGGAAIDRHGMALGRIARGAGAAVHQRAQDASGVVRRAPDQEVVGRRAPRRLQPVEIGLEAAGRRHEGAGADRLDASVAGHGCPPEPSILDVEVPDLGVVLHLDAKPRGRAIVGVDQRLAPAEEERVGVREMQGAAQRRLEAHAVGGHPLPAARRPGDHQPGPASRWSARRSRPAGPASTPPRGRSRSADAPGRRACSAGCACAGCCRRGSAWERTRAAARSRPPSGP